MLFALDVVDSAVSEPDEAEKVRRAVRLLTRTLWPELGDLSRRRGRGVASTPMVKLASSGVRSTEAARRLGIDGADVYRMLFAGELEGGPGKDGIVYFDEASIDAYLERHGFGVVAEPSTGSSTGSSETSPDRGARASTSESRNRSSEAQSDTDENRPLSGPSGS